MASPAAIYVGLIDGNGAVSVIDGTTATNFASAKNALLIAVKHDSNGNGS